MASHATTGLKAQMNDTLRAFAEAKPEPFRHIASDPLARGRLF
jgi:hypothetical protein